jgi:hypothetical protein
MRVGRALPRLAKRQHASHAPPTALKHTKTFRIRGPPVNQGLSLPEPAYPRFPEKLSDPGPETPPERRDLSR